MSYTQLYCHIVFRTYKGQQTIKKENASRLYAYIKAIVQNNKCELHVIGGMPDHIHLFIRLHQSVRLSDLIRDIKSDSSKWIKKNKELFPHFTSWAAKYCALSHGYKQKDIVIEYIKNQEEHHRKIDSEQEMRKLILSAGIYIDEKYWEI